MGLTLHYRLTAPAACTARRAAALVRRLHATASTWAATGRFDAVDPITSDRGLLDRFGNAWRTLPHPDDPQTSVGVHPGLLHARKERRFPTAADSGGRLEKRPSVGSPQESERRPLTPRKRAAARRQAPALPTKRPVASGKIPGRQAGHAAAIPSTSSRRRSFLSRVETSTRATGP